VVHVVLGKGIQPLILHHVRRQNALFTSVFLGVSRGNNCRKKLHWTLRAEFHQATADDCQLSRESWAHLWSWGGCRRWRHPASRRRRRHVMRGRLCDWFYPQERDWNVNVFWSMKTRALLRRSTGIWRVTVTLKDARPIHIHVKHIHWVEVNERLSFMGIQTAVCKERMATAYSTHDRESTSNRHFLVGNKKCVVSVLPRFSFTYNKNEFWGGTHEAYFLVYWFPVRKILCC
jgi:hypothetical protein